MDGGDFSFILLDALPSSEFESHRNNLKMLCNQQSRIHHHWIINYPAYTFPCTSCLTNFRFLLTAGDITRSASLLQTMDPECRGLD